MQMFETISGVLKELSGVENISLESQLKEDLMLDSLSMITMLIEIETAFEIELEESDLNPFDLTVVSDLVNLVKKYCGEIENEEES
ncbi:MAG: hypothetical protein IJF49_00825 [Clostridia bacterium]|nr:hypothetical protein [Clostridia bacterium]